MLKRKVHVVWLVVLATVAVIACAFATVIYVRYGRQNTDLRIRDIGNIRFFEAGRDAEGVRFEAVDVHEIGSDTVLEVRWVNRSGMPIRYGADYELYRLTDSGWEKIEPEFTFPAIAYGINSGSSRALSYTIPEQIGLIPGVRYRLQAKYQLQSGDKYSEPMENNLEFEVTGMNDYSMEEAYTYHSEQGFASIRLDRKKQTFVISAPPLSSYIPRGSYTETDGYLICKTPEDNGNTYTFRIKNETLVYVAGRSSAISLCRYVTSDLTAGGSAPDGAVFQRGLLSPKTDIPSLRVYTNTTAAGEANTVTAPPCNWSWTVAGANGTTQSSIGCGSAIDAKESLPEISVEAETSVLSSRNPNEVWLQFDLQPETVRVQCVPRNGGEIETVSVIFPFNGSYSFVLKDGSFVYRVDAEWDGGNRVEYGFVGNTAYLPDRSISPAP